MNNRRKFISVAGLAVIGASVTTLRGQPLVSHASPAERDVFRVVAEYGTKESVTRTTGPTGTVSLKVRIHSHEAFADAFVGPRGLPFDKIHASGNTLRFQHKGVNFLLENLA